MVCCVMLLNYVFMCLLMVLCGGVFFIDGDCSWFSLVFFSGDMFGLLLLMCSSGCNISLRISMVVSSSVIGVSGECRVVCVIFVVSCGI